jgi:hypothetical protein
MIWQRYPYIAEINKSSIFRKGATCTFWSTSSAFSHAVDNTALGHTSWLQDPQIQVLGGEKVPYLVFSDHEKHWACDQPHIKMWPSRFLGTYLSFQNPTNISFPRFSLYIVQSYWFRQLVSLTSVTHEFNQYSQLFLTNSSEEKAFCTGQPLSHCK